MHHGHSNRYYFVDLFTYVAFLLCAQLSTGEAKNHGSKLNPSRNLGVIHVEVKTMKNNHLSPQYHPQTSAEDESCCVTAARR